MGPLRPDRKRNRRPPEKNGASNRSQSPGCGASIRLFRVLLLAYPKDFQERYALEMEQLYRDLSRDRTQSIPTFWAHLVYDTLRAAAMERQEQMKRSVLAMLAAATAVGLAIAWVDSRPNWDDTGITAGVLLLTSAVFGAASPRLPWLWALAIGLWIPLNGLLHGNASTILVLGITFAGAFIGSGLRRAFAPPTDPAGDRP